MTPPIETLARANYQAAAERAAAAAERAYSACLESLREDGVLPAWAQSWNEMHPTVRKAWIKAVEAAEARD